MLKLQIFKTRFFRFLKTDMHKYGDIRLSRYITKSKRVNIIFKNSKNFQFKSSL